MPAAIKRSVSATCKDHLLTVVISDNGKGYNTDKITPGNGLINLSERAGKNGCGCRNPNLLAAKAQQ